MRSYSLNTLLTTTTLFLNPLLHFGQSNTLKVGDQAPSLYVQEWLTGAPIESFKNGHIYVLEFGATHCAPCRQVIPYFSSLSQKYQGKASFISIHIWENNRLNPNDLSYITRIRDYVKSAGEKVNFSIAVDVPEQKTADLWMRAAGKVAIPTVFIVDSSRKLIWIGNPFSVDSILEQVVEKTYDPVKYAKSIQEKKVEQDKDFLKIGDFAPPLSISKWLKSPTDLHQSKSIFKKAQIVVISNGIMEMHNRKSIHLVNRIAQKYGDQISIVWLYSLNPKNESKADNFINHVNNKINYSVALDTQSQTSKSWNTKYKGPITAFVLDSSSRIAWFGHPVFLEHALINFLSNNFEPFDPEIILDSFNKINNSRDSYAIKLQRIDSLISAYPNNQFLYYLTYQFLLSHNETEQGKKIAESWLIKILDLFKDKFFYWEYAINDILHAIIKHHHQYPDLLISIMDKVILEAETPELALNFIRVKANIFSISLEGSEGITKAIESLKNALDNSDFLNPKDRSSLVTDYYLYKLKLATMTETRLNHALREIYNEHEKGVNYDILIDFALKSHKKLNYQLLLKIANRYLSESTELKTMNIEDHGKALAAIGQVYLSKGNIDKAILNYQKALEVSEKTMNEKAIEYYKKLLLSAKGKE